MKGQRWQRSIKERQRLIVELKRRGIIAPLDLREMNIEDIRKLLKERSVSSGGNRQKS